MNGYQFTLALVDAVRWPVVVVFIVLLLRFTR